ncbi:ABC transporter permease [Lactobacillus panisapium]|uniref:ABC transporter permease n=1 Tax=Lactobacillus panisapium TaxID=2012495 RepID=UPI001C69F90D|nr:ABC transporter permease [Lactobacillus panisapium]QYN57553.1 ABC transporter permease [Lactobacillus panisapium]
MNRKSAVWLIIPAFLGVLVFTFFPLIEIAIPTFQSSNGFFALYTQFLKSSYNWEVIGRTFLIAIITVVVVLILGLPISLWIGRQKTTARQVLSLLILFPMLTNAVVRNFAWIIILGHDGIINKFLLALHLINVPLDILYTNSAIIIGSVYLFLPIMINSLVGSISELNVEIEEAAAILGSNPWHTLFKVVIPQLTMGILTGCILVFAGSMTAYTTPQILGGNRHLVMSTLIYQQAMTLGNWQNASVIALILILISALSMWIMRRMSHYLDRRPDNA